MRKGSHHTAEARAKIGIAKRGNTYTLGRLTPRLAPTERAIPSDFRWVAGFFEGEGSVNLVRNGSISATIAQKDRRPLDYIRSRFGGSIQQRNDADMFDWHIHGARARGFLMSIYGLLFPRRQEQIRKVMQIGCC